MADPRINKRFQNRRENRRLFSPTVSPSLEGNTSAYSLNLDAKSSPSPSNHYAASSIQENWEAGDIDGSGAGVDRTVASPRRSLSPRYSEDYSHKSDTEMSPSQLKYAMNKPFPSGRSQIIHRMLRHGEVIDNESKKSTKTSPRKDYQKIFKEGAEKVVKLNSFKQPDVEDGTSRSNSYISNRVISAPASFSDSLYVPPLSKWKTVYKSSLQRHPRDLEEGRNEDTAESTIKDRHEDSSYSLRKSPASFSYPRNPDSITRAYPGNSKDNLSRKKKGKASANENSEDHPLYFESNKDAAKTVRKNKRIIKPSSRIMRKKYMSAASKDKRDHRQASSPAYKHTHVEVALNSNSTMGLYRRKSVLRKRESTKILGTAAAKANLKFKPGSKSGLVQHRQRHQLSTKPKQSVIISKPELRTTVSHRTSIKEVEENVGLASMSNMSNIVESNTNSSARHHGPFLAAPRVKRKESLLSAPSGIPIESVYNVRNKKADGKYTGRNSHLGSEQMNDVLDDIDVISRKKRYTNYLRRGEGVKKRRNGHFHKEASLRSAWSEKAKTDRRNGMYDYEEQKNDILRHESGYKYDSYNLRRERRGSDGEARTQISHHHGDLESHSVIEEEEEKGNRRRKPREWKARNEHAGVDNMRDSTDLKSRRARDIDPDDYQGGEDEFDEIIKRWKERRNVSNSKRRHMKVDDNSTTPVVDQYSERAILTPDLPKKKKRDHQDGNSVDTKLQFHLKFNTLYTYDEHGNVIPPWRRERLESQIPRIVKRRVKLIRNDHSGPPQWILYHDYGKNGNDPHANNSNLYEQQRKLSDALNRQRYKLNHQDEQDYNRFNHQQQQLHPKRNHANAILINSSQAAIIFAQINLLKKYFELLIDYTSRTRWERACVSALCERRAETHLPYVFRRWHAMYRAVRWHRLRLLSISVMKWKMYKIECFKDRERMTHASMYFKLKNTLHGVRRWREYANKKIVMGRLKLRAIKFQNFNAKKKHFAAWSSASRILTSFETKMDVAEESNRFRLMHKAFNTMKMNVGICVLINLLDLKRARALLKNTFLIWCSRTKLTVCVHGGLEKAILYNNLRILGRAFWAWENTTKGHIAEANAKWYSIQQDKRRAIKSWYDFAVSRRSYRSKSRAARVYYRVRKLQIVFENWKDWTKDRQMEDQAALFHDLRGLTRGVYRWNQFVHTRKLYRLQKKKAALQFFYIMFRRWKRSNERSRKERLAVIFAATNRKKKSLQLLFQHSKRNIKDRAQTYVALAFFRRTTLYSKFRKWDKYAIERRIMYDNIVRGKNHYKKVLRSKVLRGFRLEVLEGKEMLRSALQLRRAHDSSKVQHCIQFWHWWAHRDRAISQYFFQRRVAIIFVGWRRYVETRRMEKESLYLAKLKFKSSLFSKTFDAWRDITATLILRRQVNHGAIVWGNRKLLSRKLRGWRSRAKSMAVHRGKIRLANDFARLVLMNKVLISWQALLH